MMTVFPADQMTGETNLLRVVYDHGKPVPDNASACPLPRTSFADLKARLANDWPACAKTFDPVSAALKARVADTIAMQRALNTTNTIQ
jgi:hypothetical protein